MGEGLVWCPEDSDSICCILYLLGPVNLRLEISSQPTEAARILMCSLNSLYFILFPINCIYMHSYEKLEKSLSKVCQIRTSSILSSACRQHIPVARGFSSFLEAR